jgi:cyclic beta-1,2-glucan synthetase
MWRLGVEAILGLRMEDGHMRIDPCVPPSWKGFEAWIRLGEQSLHVVIDNPDHVATGVATITLDGARLESNLILPDPSATGTHEVQVRLGSPARSANPPQRGVQDVVRV